MREGTQLRVAKAARSPPCTLPFPGRRSIFFPMSYTLNDLLIFSQLVMEMLS